MEKTVELLNLVDNGFIFTNLNDFDSKYGHRRDVRGYADALELSMRRYPPWKSHLRPGDELIITADHGCDPTAPGSDHTREYAPFIHLSARHGAVLGELDGFDVVGRTVKEALLAVNAMQLAAPMARKRSVPSWWMPAKRATDIVAGRAAIDRDAPIVILLGASLLPRSPAGAPVLRAGTRWPKRPPL